MNFWQLSFRKDWKESLQTACAFISLNNLQCIVLWFFSPFYSINWANFRRNTTQWNIFLLLVTAVRCTFLFAPFFLYLLLLWHFCTMKKSKEFDQETKGIPESFSIFLIKKKKKGLSPRKLLLTRNNPFIWYKACLPVSVAPSISLSPAQRNKVQRWNLEKQPEKCTRPDALQKHEQKCCWLTLVQVQEKTKSYFN